MLWIKALHIIFVVCWFSGIFYLPRLFVNHALTDNEDVRAHLLIMQRKLYRFTTGLAVLAVFFGILLASESLSFYLSQTWFLVKLGFIVALIAYHVYCGIIIRQFSEHKNSRSHIWFRWFNEAPVLILFVVVILAVVKPF